MIDETRSNAPNGTDASGAETRDGADERIGFCQDCGRPLTRETARTVGSGMFCEPCLEVRLAAAAAAAGGPAYTAVPPTPPPGSLPVGTFPPLGGDNPSPGLALLLGFIPGVGAIYNGQFAKGIAHIVIFALLSTMGHVSDLFGFLAFLWCCYQAYEAFHTAKARREGLPLPDPLNLNNIGEHFGAGGQFRANPYRPQPGQPVPPYTPPYVSPNPPPANPWASYVPPAAPPGSPFSAPDAAVPPPQSWGSVPAAPPVTAYAQPAWTAPVAAPGYVPPASAVSRFPASAVWLIGLGVVFLLATLDSDRFSAYHAVPFFVAAFAVWILTRRMAATGGLLPREDEEGTYAPRLVCNLRWPLFLLVLAVLLGLQTFHVVTLGSTWPVLVITIGVVMLLERSVGRAAVVMPVAPLVDVDDTLKGGQ